MLNRMFNRMLLNRKDKIDFRVRDENFKGNVSLP